MSVGYRKGDLEGDWALFARIAGPFVREVPRSDQEDFLHDLLLEMVKVKAKYETNGKPLREAGLMKVASYEMRGYWDRRRYRLFALNCTHCTPEERRDCRTREPTQCPKGKARQVLSMNRALTRDNDGGKPAELWEMIPDNSNADVLARLEAREVLRSLPKQIVQLGYRKYAGYRLGNYDYALLKDFKKVRGRILDILGKKQRAKRSDLSRCLQMPTQKLEWYLAPLIKSGQVVEVRVESCRGRSQSPLLLLAEAPIPELKTPAKERDGRIRHAYFVEGWSIKRIKKELHHDKRTIRRAIGKEVSIIP